MKILLINPIIRDREPPMNFPVGIGIIANIMLEYNKIRPHGALGNVAPLVYASAMAKGV